MGPFYTAARAIAAFLTVEIVLLSAAWKGVNGEEYWIWIALAGQLLINLLVFLNLAGLASVWLLGFFGGILSPQTATESANNLATTYARWTIGFGHAVSLTILSLVFLEPSLEVYVGTVLVLTLAAQHVLTFPTTTSIYKWVSLGIITSALLALLWSAGPPLYKMWVLGEPYVSVKTENAGAKGLEAAARNEEEYRKEANDRVVKVIRMKRIRTSQLPTDLAGWQYWESLHLRDGLQVGDAQIYWETLNGIQKQSLPATGRRVVAATPGIVSSPTFIPWMVGILVGILVITAIRRGRGVWVAGVILAILVTGSFAWSKTRNEFWYGVIWPAVTGEIPVDYTTTETPATITVPAGIWKVSRVEPGPGRDSYTMECRERGHAVGQGHVLSGTIRVNSVPVGGRFTSMGSATITLAVPPNCIKVTGPVNATIYLAREH